MEKDHDISSGKMSQVHTRQTRERTSDVSSRASARSKTQMYMFLQLKNGNLQERSWEMITPLLGEPSMLSTGESPREEDVSTLLEILQVGVQEKYYLSPKACLGILRRAQKRGKELPTVLRIALEIQALSA